MQRFLYACIPSFCFAVPVAQIMPDLHIAQGVEKLGIVGVMTLGMMFFLWERRHFLAKTAQELQSMDKRLGGLEATFAAGNDRVIHLLGEQLAAMREIKTDQAENFSRMWGITLRSLGGEKNEIRTRSSDREKDVLRSVKGEKRS